jgi:hypothetical protein
MKAIKINKGDLVAILHTLDSFDDVLNENNVTITQQESGSGIGYRLEILFDTKINGIPGVFKVDLTEPNQENGK